MVTVATACADFHSVGIEPMGLADACRRSFAGACRDHMGDRAAFVVLQGLALVPAGVTSFQLRLDDLRGAAVAAPGVAIPQRDQQVGMKCRKVTGPRVTHRCVGDRPLSGRRDDKPGRGEQAVELGFALLSLEIAAIVGGRAGQHDHQLGAVALAGDPGDQPVGALGEASQQEQWGFWCLCAHVIEDGMDGGFDLRRTIAGDLSMAGYADGQGDLEGVHGIPSTAAKGLSTTGHP